MTSKIAIARPAVNLKALRRYRISIPRKIVTETHQDYTFDSSSTVAGYEQRTKEILSSCRGSKSPVFISTVFLVSSVLFPAVWFGKAFKSVSPLRSRLPFPFLSMTVLGIFTCASFVAFPIIALSISVLVGISVTLTRRFSMETRRLGNAVNDRLCHIDAHIAHRCAQLQMVLENQASDFLDRLEESGQAPELNNSSPPQLEQSQSLLLTTAQGAPKQETPLEKGENVDIDMELGQLPPNPAFQTNRNRLTIPQDIPEARFAPTIYNREAKVQLLKELQPNLEVELKRLRLIPAFDAEGWLFVSNPDLDAQLDEELKRETCIDIFPSGRKARESKSL